VPSDPSLHTVTDPLTGQTQTYSTLLSDWRTRNVTTTDNGENTAEPIYNWGDPTKDSDPYNSMNQWYPQSSGTDK